MSFPFQGFTFSGGRDEYANLSFTPFNLYIEGSAYSGAIYKVLSVWYGQYIAVGIRWPLSSHSCVLAAQKESGELYLGPCKPQAKSHKGVQGLGTLQQE